MSVVCERQSARSVMLGIAMWQQLRWAIVPEKREPKVGAAVPSPFFGGSWVLIQHNVAWAEDYLHTK